LCPPQFQADLKHRQFAVFRQLSSNYLNLLSLDFSEKTKVFLRRIKYTVEGKGINHTILLGISIAVTQKFLEQSRVWVVIPWRRGCGGTVSPRLGSDGLVNLVVTIRIRFTGYTRETSIANKR